MRFNPAFLGACLIGAAACIAAPEFNSAALAQDGQAAEEKEKYTLDESIFDIEEGQSADYYVKAEEKLRAEMNKFIAATPNVDDRVGVFGKANAALEKIWMGTFNAEDASDEARAKVARIALPSLLSSLADEGKTDEIVALIKRIKGSESKELKAVERNAAYALGSSIASAAKDLDDLLDSLKRWKEAEGEIFTEDVDARAVAVFCHRLAAEGKTDEIIAFMKRFKDSEEEDVKKILNSELNISIASDLGTSIASAAKDVDGLLDSLKRWEEAVKGVFSKRDVTFYSVAAFYNRLIDEGEWDELEKLINLYKDSEDLKGAVMGREAEIRFAKLVGNEMVVEGLYLDKTEIDWKSYRGKVVLVDFWATWCPPCLAEIPNVQKLYEKYHDAGFEVLGYSVDRDLEALEKFEEERKLPWKTASRTLSIAAEKEYVNLSDYYGVETIPTMILVGKDGKVISTEARGAELKRLLEEQFPDVK